MSGGHDNWTDRLNLNAGESFADLDRADQVDVVCDAFERFWQNGTEASIESFLDGAPLDEETVQRIEQELIPLEYDFRREAGAWPTFGEYAKRFPHQALFVARFLCDEGFLEKMDPPPRKLGRYLLLEVAGRGSFGVVHRAYDRQMDRFVAVKVPSTSLGDEESVRRFQREARNAGRLSHPGIVPLYYAEKSDDGHPYIVSDFVSGETLDEFLKSQRRLNPRTAASLVAQVAESLDYAHHHGIIHRDLKPGNIILETRKIGDSTQDGTPDDSLRPKVLDFGLARRQDGDASVSIHGAVVGTPAYMSPEQARGDSNVDHRADIYSLGAILYEALFGERCFSGETFSAVLIQVVSEEPKLPRSDTAKVPRDLTTICMKCLRKVPTERYESAAALAEDLRRWLRDEEIRARPMSTTEKSVRWFRRNRGLTGAIATTLALAALLMWLVNWRGEISKRREQIAELVAQASPGKQDDVIRSVREQAADDPKLKDLVRRLAEDSTNIPDQQRLRYRLVLADELQLTAALLLDDLDLSKIQIEELIIVAQFLRELGLLDDDRERLRNIVKGKQASSDQRLRLAVCLSLVDSEWSGWSECSEWIVEALLQDDLNGKRWAIALRPLAERLLPVFRERFLASDEAQLKLVGLVTTLAEGDFAELTWFLAQARGPELEALCPALRSPAAVAFMQSRLAELSELPPWHLADDDQRDEGLVIERVNLALTKAFAEGQDACDVLGQLLASDEDPRPRTYFIQRAQYAAPLSELVREIDCCTSGTERDELADDMLYCLLLAISLCDAKDLGEDKLLAETLETIYRSHPDSGVHSAAGYCMLRQGKDLTQLNRDEELLGYRKDRDWFHTSFGACMIVIRPGRFEIWAFRLDQAESEGIVRTIEIEQPIAVAATELTENEYSIVMGGEFNGSEIPKVFLAVTGADAQMTKLQTNVATIGEVCRQVDQSSIGLKCGCFCLPPEDGVWLACDRSVPGSRMAIALEWLVCCNADAIMARYFGTMKTAADHFISNGVRSEFHNVHAYFPNRSGFFDMYGNTYDLSLTEHSYALDYFPIDSKHQQVVVVPIGANLTYHGGNYATKPQYPRTLHSMPAFSAHAKEAGLRLTTTLTESVNP